MKNKIKVIHLVLGLGKGGAETMLFNILKNQNNNKINYMVISLGVSDYYSKLMMDLGVKLNVFDLKRKPFKTLVMVKHEIKNCEILCCWMYHANIIGYLLAKHCKIKKLIWCIRHSDLKPKHNKKLTLLINRICSYLSRNVTIVAYNGENARIVHEKIGYDKTKSVVLLNGCDTDIYKKLSDAKDKLNSLVKCNIANKKVILSISRYNPIKDIPNFIQSFSKVKNELNSVVAILCGRNIDIRNKELVKEINNNNLKINYDIFLLGQRDDLPQIMSASDLYVLHSMGEAFPNTLIEAMACELNCVTTDVGDVRQIVKGTNIEVVEPRNPNALAQAIINNLSLCEMKRIEYAKLNRKIIGERYDIKTVVKEYENIFLD